MARSGLLSLPPQAFCATLDSTLLLSALYLGHCRLLYMHRQVFSTMITAVHFLDLHGRSFYLHCHPREDRAVSL